eukprot:m.193236 g.193236  ORF g.193236 m.193236 type:complete len:825 (+) comp15179_c0_seq1:129-2603(+)
MVRAFNKDSEVSAAYPAGIQQGQGEGDVVEGGLHSLLPLAPLERYRGKSLLEGTAVAPTCQRRDHSRLQCVGAGGCIRVATASTDNHPSIAPVPHLRSHALRPDMGAAPDSSTAHPQQQEIQGMAVRGSREQARAGVAAAAGGHSPPRHPPLASAPPLSLPLLVLLALSPASTDAACAFAGNASGHVDFPRSETAVNASAFITCHSLVTITLPDTVTRIGARGFEGATALVHITIPDSVTTIESRAFAGAVSLVTVRIGTGVVSVGTLAFALCHALASVSITNASTHFVSGSSALPTCYGYGLPYVNRSLNAPVGLVSCLPCSGVPHLVVPAGVASIASNAFQNCPASRVTLPDTLTTIGVFSFGVMNSLASVTLPASVVTVQAFGLASCYGFGLRFTAAADNDPRGAVACAPCGGLQTVAIPDTVSTIGRLAFTQCMSLTSLHFPDSVSTIEEQAFSTCLGLTEVTLPNSVTTIGRGAFENCHALRTVAIPSSVTAFNPAAFSNAGCNGSLYAPGASLCNCVVGTCSPTAAPTAPTRGPTAAPTAPTRGPTPAPTAPTRGPTAPTSAPTAPTHPPTRSPTRVPTRFPTTQSPTNAPTQGPTASPSAVQAGAAAAAGGSGDSVGLAITLVVVLLAVCFLIFLHQRHQRAKAAGKRQERYYAEQPVLEANPAYAVVGPDPRHAPAFQASSDHPASGRTNPRTDPRGKSKVAAPRPTAEPRYAVAVTAAGAAWQDEEGYERPRSMISLGSDEAGYEIPAPLPPNHPQKRGSLDSNASGYSRFKSDKDDGGYLDVEAGGVDEDTAFGFGSRRGSMSSCGEGVYEAAE